MIHGLNNVNTNSSEILGPRKPTASIQKLKAIASTDDSTILQDQSIIVLGDESFQRRSATLTL